MIKLLLLFSVLILLSACEIDQMKMKICSYSNKEAMSTVDVTAYYTAENVPKIVIELTQQFDKETMKSMGKERLMKIVENAMVSTAGENNTTEVEFDDKKRKVHVKLTLFTEDMVEEELESFNLHESKEIAKFVEKFKNLGYTCKDVKE